MLEKWYDKYIGHIYEALTGDRIYTNIQRYYVETDLLYLHNKERKDDLIFSEELQIIAEEHADWMKKSKRLSHTGQDRSSVSTRAKNTNIKFSYIGENIASGQRTPEKVFDAWMNSRGHRRNILNSNYTHCGFGRSGNYWCAVYAKLSDQEEIFGEMLSPV